MASVKPERPFRSAVGWATFLTWGQDGLSGVSTFVLAYLIGPEDFGVVVAGVSLIGLLETSRASRCSRIRERDRPAAGG
jgi:O-antigen/teichoic acid export membrane protein